VHLPNPEDVMLPPTPMALLRFSAISAYLAEDPPRGQRGALLDKLASKTWTLPDGRQVHFAAETLRTWVRRYRLGGLDALADKPLATKGVQVLTPEQITLLCDLKKEVPERSLDRILQILADMALVEPGVVTRSTLHRALKAHGLSGRPKPQTSDSDLDRYEADLPNDLWQSDMLVGPWLPDPAKPGKLRRAYLYAFIDDHSRLLLSGRFSFKGDLPALELVFRQAVRRHGLPRKVYYDNGATYRSKHMQQVVAALGIHRIVFTTPYRPMGHGKVEAFNRLCRSAFIAEVKASSIETLDALNAAFQAWVERFYNRRIHGETNQTPRDRWRAGLETVRHLDEEVLRRGFLWTEKRTPDKTGVFSLLGRRYQVGTALARKRVEVRYDPEHLDELEVWHEKRFQERVRPFQVRTHRRPKPTVSIEAQQPQPEAKPTADWLGHLVAERGQVLDLDPERELKAELERRRLLDEAVVDALRSRLDADVFDEAVVFGWLERFGPLDTEPVVDLLDFALPSMGTSLHVQEYLDMLHAALLQGGEA